VEPKFFEIFGVIEVPMMVVFVLGRRHYSVYFQGLRVHSRF